jgi:hypothetical protein
MNMNNEQNIILSIYPNTRGFGYVCLESPKNLIDYGIVTIRPICNRRIMKRIKKIVSYFRPVLVLVQDCDKKYSRQGNRIKNLIDNIVAFAKENNIPVVQYSREQIRDVFEQFEAKSKYQIANKIIEWIPELEPRKPKARKLWMSEDYNMGVFDALSLALTHYYMSE